MQTAYYKRQSGQIVSIDAESLKLDNGVSLRYDRDSLFCPNCGERVFYAGGSETPELGRTTVRAAHFKHQKRQNCVVEDCDLRVDVDSDCYISQKLRMPLFLRPCGNGKFVLSAGFSTANKDALRRLRAGRFRALSITCGKDKLELSIDDLLRADGIAYVNIPAPLTKMTSVKMAMLGQNATQSLSESNEEWSDLLDCFVNDRGAVFQYSAGNAGEKLRAGSLITSGRPYLLLEKNTGADWVKTPITKLHEKYGFLYESQGQLSFQNSGASYSVHKVVFPSAAEVTKQEYESLFDYLREKFGVLLTDELKEVRPLWPPAVRKGDAYGVQAKQVYLTGNCVEDGEILYLHKNYGKVEELSFHKLHDLHVVNLPLLTRRTPVSFEGIFSGSISMYRNERLPQPAEHGIELVDDHRFMTIPGQYKIPYRSTMALCGTCDFTVYRSGHDAASYQAGEVIRVAVKPGERILLQTCAGVVFDILMQNSASKSESNGNYKKYRGTDRYEKY